MKRMLVLVLTGALTFPQCAARSSMGHAAAVPQPQSRVVDRPEVMRRYVEKLPIGTIVHLELTSGRQMDAVLMAVDADAITVKPRTRVPEAAQTVPIDTIVRLEPAAPGGSVGRSIGVGVASGMAGTLAGLMLLILLAHVWD